MASDNGEPTVIVVAPGAEATGDGEGVGEVAAVVEGEAVETAADAAVEIARIEADRDITLAAINAETMEASNEAFANSETELWRARALAAETTLETLQSSTPPLLIVEPPSLPEEPPRTEAGEDGSREDPEEPEPEVVEEAEAAAEAPEPPPKARKFHRWI